VNNREFAFEDKEIMTERSNISVRHNNKSSGHEDGHFYQTGDYIYY
jgi:hypothetical protein